VLMYRVKLATSSRNFTFPPSGFGNVAHVHLSTSHLAVVFQEVWPVEPTKDVQITLNDASWLTAKIVGANRSRNCKRTTAQLGRWKKRSHTNLESVNTK